MDLRKALAKAPRVIGLGVLYFIVWFVLYAVIFLLIETFYFQPLMGRIPDQIEQLQMVRVSQVISGILVLAHIFRKQLFGKKNNN